MNTLFQRLLICSTAVLFSNNVIAIDLMSYSRNVPAASAQEPARSTVMGIFDSCGNASNLNDDCIMQGLTRVATEENNTVAKAIADSYDNALTMGSSEPDCQTETHLQANRIVGHCLLLLNYSTLKNGTPPPGDYETCLQGGMLGLTYQGNIVAQYFMVQLFEQKGIPDAAQAWKNGLEMRKDTNEYELLMKCYR